MSMLKGGFGFERRRMPHHRGITLSSGRMRDYERGLPTTRSRETGTRSATTLLREWGSFRANGR